MEHFFINLLPEMQYFLDKKRKNPNNLGFLADFKWFLREFNEANPHIPKTNFYYNHGDFRMAKFDWRFINIPLSEIDKPRLKIFAEGYDNDAWSALSDVMSQGYKCGQNWVDSANAFCATITATDNCKFNTGCTLTAWSDSLEEAVFMVCFKHLGIAKGGDWSDHATNDRWG